MPHKEPTHLKPLAENLAKFGDGQLTHNPEKNAQPFRYLPTRFFGRETLRIAKKLEETSGLIFSLIGRFCKFDPSLHLLGVNKMNLSKSVATSSSNPLEHMLEMVQQQAMGDNIIGINLEKDAAIDPSFYGLQNVVFRIT